MPITHEFEEHNFNKEENLTEEISIVNKKDIEMEFIIGGKIPSMSNLISNVSNVAKTTGSVADANSKITQAVKS